MIKTSTLFIIGLVISCGCSSGHEQKQAASHFQANQKAIEDLAAFYRAHPEIDYVEFIADGSIDLWILDKESFDRTTSPAKFKHQLWKSPVDSPEVSKALEYAGVSRDTFLKLKEFARLAGCISLK